VESVVLPLVEMIRENNGLAVSVVIDEGMWEDIGDAAAYARVEHAVPPLHYEKNI
jgi:hypothetical protein